MQLTNNNKKKYIHSYWKEDWLTIPAWCMFRLGLGLLYQAVQKFSLKLIQIRVEQKILDIHFESMILDTLGITLGCKNNLNFLTANSSCL